MKRFSKAALVEHLRCEIDRIAKKYKFDLSNGTAQLRAADQDRILAYGEMKALQWLMHDINGGSIGK